MNVIGQELFDGTKFIGKGTLRLKAGKIEAVAPGGTGGAALVAPGFVDSHLHLIGLGIDRQGLRLYNCRGLEQFTQSLRDYAKNGEGWLIGRGWNQGVLGFTPDRRLLDSLCPHRPVMLSRACCHVVAVNSKALELAGITDSTAVDGGVIERDNSGQPTGILEENAIALVKGIIPRPDLSTLYTALVDAIKYVHSLGITGAHSDDRGAVGDYSKLWELYQRVVGSYPLRTQLHYSTSSHEDLREYIRLAKEIRDTEFLTKGAAKIFLDGSLGARTATLLEDYSDSPGRRGVYIYSDEYLEQLMAIAEANGTQLAAHVIGDGASEQFLRVLAKVRGGYKPGPVSHRLVHFQITNNSQIQRAKSLGLVIEIQPVFLPTDSQFALERVGRHRLQTSYCWRTLDGAGLFLTGGSDAPVEDPNPWPGVAAATAPRGPEQYSDWEQDESLGLERALSLFTSASAELAGWRDSGTLRPGSRADLAIYPQFDRENVAVTKPDRVLIQGTTVYQR